MVCHGSCAHFAASWQRTRRGDCSDDIGQAHVCGLSGPLPPAAMAEPHAVQTHAMESCLVAHMGRFELRVHGGCNTYGAQALGTVHCGCKSVLPSGGSYSHHEHWPLIPTAFWTMVAIPIALSFFHGDHSCNVLPGIPDCLRHAPLHRD